MDFDGKHIFEYMGVDGKFSKIIMWNGWVCRTFIHGACIEMVICGNFGVWQFVFIYSDYASHTSSNFLSIETIALDEAQRRERSLNSLAIDCC